jgi:hypothetical protein
MILSSFRNEINEFWNHYNNICHFEEFRRHFLGVSSKDILSDRNLLY